MTYAPDSLDAYMRCERFAPRKPAAEAAVRGYAPEIGQDCPTGTKVPDGDDRASAPDRSSERDQDQAARQSRAADDQGEGRSFEMLLAAAKALRPMDIVPAEALCAEAALLTPLRRDQVLRAIGGATGIKLTVLREQEKGGREIDESDHLDLAKMTLEGIGRDNIICADHFVWRWSKTGVWEKYDDRALKQDVQKALHEARSKVTAARVNGVADVLATEIYRQEHRFNIGNPETVNCLNGEVELDGRNWVLKPPRREHYRTTQIPVVYDTSAEAPMFQEFLVQIFRDDPDRKEKMQAVLELIGYSLMSHANHEKFVMLIGPGANGKSVLLVVLEALLGCGNVAGVQPANFDRSFQRAHLNQKLANIVTELKQGEVIAEAELKAITSGEPSTVEHKFKDPFVMRPFATCWFGANHMPHTRDFSEALFRRATILTFDRTFEPHEQDPRLKDKRYWEPELAGILNMALAAYGRAIKNGFTHPSSSEAAKREWRLEADQAAQFVEDACVSEASSSEKAADVFLAYQNWALANGISKTMSAKGLRDRLTRLGCGSHRDKHGRYVTGIRLLDGAWG